MELKEVLLPYVSLAAGLAALVFCGNYLVTGGVHLARHFKISTLVVGLTVVAFGTSAPELFVSIGAAFKGAPDIAIGNVIGSNIANIALVLGLTALILPIPIKSRSILFDMIIMLSITIIIYILGSNGIIGLIEGICLVSILVAYIVWSLKRKKRKLMLEEGHHIPETAAMKPLLAVLLVIASVTGLYFGSEWFINGARDIARQWGVSERIIGISVVAVGTSMPELVASVVAAVRKEMDISIGNIVGSNIFNMVMVLGVTSIIKPLTVSNIRDFTHDMIWVFGVAVLLLLAMIPFNRVRSKQRLESAASIWGKISRWKGGILFSIYAVYIFLLYVR